MRVASEFERDGGLARITAGREVESDLPIAVLTAAAAKVHSRGTVDLGAPGYRLEDLAERVSTGLDTMSFAAEAVAGGCGVRRLRERMAAAVDHVRALNGLGPPAVQPRPSPCPRG